LKFIFTIILKILILIKIFILLDIYGSIVTWVNFLLKKRIIQTKIILISSLIQYLISLFRWYLIFFRWAMLLLIFINGFDAYRCTWCNKSLASLTLTWSLSQWINWMQKLICILFQNPLIFQSSIIILNFRITKSPTHRLSLSIADLIPRRWII